MPSRLLADLVLLAHLAFILFAVFGALAALAWRWAPLVHLPALAWGAWIELTHGVCPLTPLEDSLRRAAGEAGLSGSFVDHYLAPIVYPPGISDQGQAALAAVLLVVNAVLYGLVAWRRGRGPAGRRR
jgi:hypothetical protein